MGIVKQFQEFGKNPDIFIVATDPPVISQAIGDSRSMLQRGKGVGRLVLRLTARSSGEYGVREKPMREFKVSGLIKCQVVAVLATITLAACQTTSTRTAGLDSGIASSNYKIGRPYQVAGVWYYPKEDFSYNETGLASWYGGGFHGKRTANGEIYNKNRLTAAHKTLPMPVMARVTNLENGKQVVVRINDRGPFVRGRIIDLSAHAADLLDFKTAGVAKVRVEYIGKADKETRIVAKAFTYKAERRVEAAAPVNPVDSGELAPLAGAAQAAELTNYSKVNVGQYSEFRQVPLKGDANIYVQAGSFQMRDNAIRLKSSLERSGYRTPGVEIRTAKVKGIQYYRVQIGPLAMVDSADQMLERVLNAGYAGARIIIN